MNLLRRVLNKLRFYNNLGKRKNIIIENYFKSTSSRRVLLSYVATAFNEDNLHNNKHTNIYTTRIIAELFNELGYAVDIVNWNDDYQCDFNKYALVFGLGKTIDNALTMSNRNYKVIWFGTGCNPFYSNVVTIKRVLDFYIKYKCYLIESSRFIAEDWPLQHEVADWIILHGDKFALSTYRNYNISSIKAPIFINNNIPLNKKNWNTASKNYIWFGSHGAIHKGLDLVLDAFLENDGGGLNLHICGNIKNETRFFDCYKERIDAVDYIHYHGNVDINSKLFEDLMLTCGFIIFPSISEGNSPSVITCMANGGIIPIVTASADIDITHYGIEIKEPTSKSVLEAVRISQELTLTELQTQATEILKTSQLCHTFGSFRNELRKQINEIILKQDELK